MTSNGEEAEAFAKRVYETKVRPTLDAEPIGWFLSVDMFTEDYELRKRDIEAVDRLLQRRPEASIFITRVGFDCGYEWLWPWRDAPWFAAA